MLGQIGGLAQQCGCSLEFRGKLDVIGHRVQASVVRATDERIQARLVLEVSRLKLGLRHIDGIERGTKRLGAKAVNKRLIVGQAVPRAVVDFRETPHVVDTNRIQPCLVTVTERLSPEQVVHDLGRFHQVHQELPLVVRQPGQIGGEQKVGVDLGARRYVGHCYGLRAHSVLDRLGRG